MREEGCGDAGRTGALTPLFTRQQRLARRSTASCGTACYAERLIMELTHKNCQNSHCQLCMSQHSDLGRKLDELCGSGDGKVLLVD